ncbi:MAG: hypothetical protein U9R53_08065, partial [Chloroflexota bacterium]|nr:hypothetical protein [Chloroflexota bacterium]
LKTGDARPLAGIFYHNAIDILSLAGLFSHTAYLLHDPLSKEIQYHEDVVSLARFFESLGDIPQTAALYQESLTLKLDESLYWDTLSRFSFLQKRREDWASALALWEMAADNNFLYAFEELAKYFEHRVKYLETALNWTIRALEVLEKQHYTSYDYQNWRESLEHRLNRLQRRLARKENE